MAHDVFVSYSSHNRVAANAVCAKLEANDVRCWIAPRDVTPGLEYGECIMDAIEQSRIMVLVFTADANKSPQVRKEVERAVNRDVVILPLRIEDVLPGRALEFFIGNVHWLDALTPPLEVHLQRLTGTVKAMLARRDEPLQINPEPTPNRGTLVIYSQWWIYGVAAALVVILAAYLAIRALSRSQRVTGSQPLTPAASQNEQDANRPVKDNVVAGSQWQAIRAREISHLYSISGTPDGKHLWTVGDSPTILQSDDRGATWHARASGAKRPSLQWIFGTADGNHVWTFDGRILQSDDGGTTWQAQENVSGEDVSSMFGTAEGLHLWMAGGQWKFNQRDGHGTVAQSDDGGMTWRVQKNMGDNELSSIFGTADGKHLWTVGGDFILQSDDGGATWRSRISVPDEHFSKIFCTPDGQHVWVVGGELATTENREAGIAGTRGHGTVAQSDDGGTTWQVHKNVGDSKLSSIFGTADGKHLWTVGGDFILQSDDSGATWRVHNNHGADYLHSIFGTADGKHLWVAAGDGSILQSNAPNQ
jgi:photosystem II stability/assembly factor-like uncharacterized protein